MYETLSVKQQSRYQKTSSSSARIAIQIFLFLVVLFGAAEIGLREYLGLGNPVLVVADPVCGYTLRPDQDVYRFYVRTQINHYGMRSGPVSESLDPHTLRVMFVGDSTTYGTTRVNQKDIFSLRIQDQLPSMIHRQVEVLNASASAWAISNEVAYVRSRGTFHANLVLLVLNSGDLTQPFSQIGNVGDALPQTRPASALSELYTRFLRPKLFHVAHREDAGTHAATGNQQMARQNLQSIEALNTFVAQQQGRLLILYIPFRRDVATGSSDSAPAPLIEMAKTNHIPVIDLTAAESSYPADDITLDHGVHFNAKGHKLLADAIQSHWREISVP